MPRNVSVNLTANVAPFTAAMGRASASAKGFGTSLGSSVQKNEANISRLSNVAGGIGLGLAAGVGIAVKSFADFDQAMSHVSATGSDAKKNIADLRGEAISLGASTVFSAKEAAGGIEELIKAGVKSKDVLGGGLKGSLDLAAAGSLGVADAANIAATAMVQFNLKGADVPHIADLLSAGANKAQGSVGDLGQALGYVGVVAGQMGFKIEETTGTLALLANNGITAEKAGTGLRGVLSSLTSPSKAAAKTMQSLGINVYDASGKLKSIAQISQTLHDKLGPLDEETRNAALGQIFSNAQLTTANVLYKNGAKGVTDWTAKVDDQGNAARTAAEKMNNLKGDFENFSGSVQTALIGLGSSADAPFRSLIKGATGAVNAFNDLGGGAKKALLGLGTGGAALALLAAGVGKIAVEAGKTKAALKGIAEGYQNLGRAGKIAAISAAGVGIALVVAGAVFAHYATLQAEAKGRTDEFTTALQGSTAEIQKNVEAVAAGQLRDSGAAEAADKLKISQKDLVQASLGNADAQARVTAALSEAEKQGTRTGQSINGVSLDYNAFSKDIKTVRDSIGLTGVAYDKAVADARRFAEGTKGATVATEEQRAALVKNVGDLKNVGDSLSALSTPYKRTAADVDALTKTVFAEGDAVQQAADTHSAYQGAIDDTTKTIEKNKETLNKNGTALQDNTAKGRSNIAALNALSSAGKAQIISLIAQGKSTEEVKRATQGVRDQFIKAAEGAGLSAKAAGKLADSYGLVPKKVSTEIDAFGIALAQQKIADYQLALSKLTKPQRIAIDTAFKKGGADAALAKLHEIQGVKIPDKKLRILTESDAKKVSKDAAHFLSSIKDGKPKVNTASNAKKVTSDAKAFLKSIKDVDPKVLTKKDLAAAQAAKKYLAGIPDKRVKVTVTTSGVGAAQSQINQVHGKTVIIRAKTVKSGNKTASADGRDGGATGGFATPAGFIYRSNGGPVWGAGTATSDSIDARLSNGEFVIRAAAAATIGAAELFRLNSLSGPQKLATGGLAGVPANVNISVIAALIAAVANPLKALSTLTSAVTAAAKNLAAVQKAGAAPKAVLDVATKNDNAARAAKSALTLENARQTAAAKKRVADARAALNSGKATKAERKELTRATAAASKVSRDNAKQVAEANAKVTATTKAKTAATAAYASTAAKSKAASDKLKDAQAALADQQKQVADTASQASASLQGQFENKSTDARDWLAILKEGADAVKAFGVKIRALRAAHLDETLIQQIAGLGVVTGTDLATNVVAGGASLIAALNLAAKNMKGQSDLLGLLLATPGSFAAGGYIRGPGTGLSDSIPARLSNGEYVVNAAATAANRGVLEAINGGGRSVISRNFVQGFASGGYAQTRAPFEVKSGDTITITGPIGYDPDLLVRRIQVKKRDALAMSGATVRL